MSNFNTVPPTQTNALARGGENAGVSSRDSGGTGAIANQTLARVVVSQVTPSVVTLTNPQNKQSIQVSAKNFAVLSGNASSPSANTPPSSITQGQAFDLVQLANKPNTFLLLAANTSSTSNRPTSGQAAAIQAALTGKLPSTVLSSAVNINDNQISNLLTKAATQGNLALSGKSSASLTGSITNIAANGASTQLTIKFQLPGSNLAAQQAQISLSSAQAQAFSKGNQVQINVDFSGKEPRIMSVSNLATNTSVSLTQSQAQLNKGALPSSFLNATLLANISGLNEQTAPGQSKLILPLNQALISLLPKTLQASFQALTNKALSNALNQNAPTTKSENTEQNLFLSIEAGKMKASISVSVLGSLAPQRFEISAAQAQALLVKPSPELKSASLNTDTGTNNSQVASPKEALPNRSGPSSSITGNAIAGNAVPSKADLIAKNALFNQQVNAFVNSSSSASSNAAQSAYKNTSESNQANAAITVQFSSNKLLQKLVAQLIQSQNQSTSSPTNTKGENAGTSTTQKAQSALLSLTNLNSAEGTRNSVDSALGRTSDGTSAKVISQLIAQIAQQVNSAKQGSATQSSSEQLGKNLLSAGNTNEATFLNLKAISQGLDTKALNGLVQELNKQSLLLSGSQSQSLASISTAISSALNSSAELDALSPETQTLLKAIKEYLPKTDNASQTLDSRTIQGLLSSPLNPPPISPITASGQGGFLSGLVTLLQVSLASKLQRQSNKQASKMQDQLPDIVKTILPGISGPQSARLLQDFRQFDAKHTLSAEVAKLLANHQHNKITSAESSLQGQDQIYYTLPNMFNKKADDLELLIKRESQEKKAATQDSETSSWYLTMKLDIGEQGKMLAKTQLTDNEIKLQLFTSTEALKNKALNMLPYLQKRLGALGIDLVERSCTLGKIPKQLKAEHYHLFEAKV